jgi:hypothetical protein
MGFSGRGGAVVELNIPLRVQRALFDEVTLFPHKVLDGDGFVGEDFEMVANQVPILAVWARDQDSSVVVSLLGQAMRRARLADFARKRQLVGRDLLALKS